MVRPESPVGHDDPCEVEHTAYKTNALAIMIGDRCADFILGQKWCAGLAGIAQDHARSRRAVIGA
ncbi:hypothetical protein D3227_10740 [Mesorhizobium waimense]|uniref:Uncharacterized protein n=1 Tax=Mesorhizobium waimense TaxID=1300307 RepID=A0A3A5KYD6_9HYPH|nr:hypothetical protein [Mesorhizobium waimense]RJT39874.1 hypothetical protein D3227_10740 [Mesorhizobium waimense]